MSKDSSNILLVNDSSIYDVEKVLSEIQGVDFKPLISEPLPFDHWDWIVIGLGSTIGVLCDLVLGKPSGFKEPKIKNDSLFGLGEKIKKFDLKNNPIDYQDLKSFGGDHRLYSYGHDMLRFFEGVQQTMTGVYKGISSGIPGEVVKEFSRYNQLPIGVAILVNLLHLFKDFFTARSLPIPGMTILAKINGNKMPEFAQKFYLEYGFNLRVLLAQVLSIAAIEIVNRAYIGLRYAGQDIEKDLVNRKLKKMLLMSHCIGGLFNVGKVIVTENPFMLNTGQFMLIFKYSFELLKGIMEDYQKRIENKKDEVTQERKLMIVNFFSINELNSITDSYEYIVKNNRVLENNYLKLLETNNHIQNNSKGENQKFDEIKEII